MNRAQIATFLWKAVGTPPRGATSSFADVPAGQYFTDAVGWMVRWGIIDRYVEYDLIADSERHARAGLYLHLGPRQQSRCLEWGPRTRLVLRLIVRAERTWSAEERPARSVQVRCRPVRGPRACMPYLTMQYTACSRSRQPIFLPSA